MDKKANGKNLSFIWNFERDEKLRKTLSIFERNNTRKMCKLNYQVSAWFKYTGKNLVQFSERKEKESKLKLGELKHAQENVRVKTAKFSLDSKTLETNLEENF